MQARTHHHTSYDRRARLDALFRKRTREPGRKKSKLITLMLRAERTYSLERCWAACVCMCVYALGVYLSVTHTYVPVLVGRC